MAYRSIIPLLLLLAAAFWPGAFACAREANVFMISGSGVYQVGKKIIAQVSVNGGGSSGINAAESVLKYDPNYLSVSSISTEGSVFKLWVTSPKVSAKDGKIIFSGGIPKSSYKDTCGKLFTIEFKALKKGDAKLQFQPSTILTADRSPVNIARATTSKAKLILGSYNDVLSAANLTKKLSGRILLQVQDNGEAWYIFPQDLKRYYLGRPHDAFNIMRKLGLGVTHKYINSYKLYPMPVQGKILIDVEKNGEAYYINPVDKKAYFLGRPADAFAIMRKLGLGINNSTLDKIPDWAI